MLRWPGASRPGCKFDQICILSGRQGIGKSLLLSRMGREWFNDSITSFDGKDARENLRGVWIVELGEMTAFSRSESEAAKQFLSQTEDGYRAASMAGERCNTPADACSSAPPTAPIFSAMPPETADTGP